ncbi:hypothetical protein DAPK24_011480 [Pichia kluyveri]|uniref:Uncharacterized protein n=1 Tax=Pichia kluyveri TaxID=36015 RepID=A0AAV5R036_PICKL|nr:hypothetical protein DAPK24_011480 [Pichia kluyveri]
MDNKMIEGFFNNETKLTLKQIHEKASALAKIFDNLTELDKQDSIDMNFEEIDKIIDLGNKISEKKKNNLTYRAANRRFGSGSFDRKAAKRIFLSMKNHIPRKYKRTLWYVTVDGYHIGELARMNNRERAAFKFEDLKKVGPGTFSKEKSSTNKFFQLWKELNDIVVEFFTHNDWFYEGLIDSQFREIYQHPLLNGKFDKDEVSSSDNDVFSSDTQNNSDKDKEIRHYKSIYSDDDIEINS